MEVCTHVPPVFIQTESRHSGFLPGKKSEGVNAAPGSKYRSLPFSFTSTTLASSSLLSINLGLKK